MDKNTFKAFLRIYISTILICDLFCDIIIVKGEINDKIIDTF